MRGRAKAISAILLILIASSLLIATFDQIEEWPEVWSVGFSLEENQAENKLVLSAENTVPVESGDENLCGLSEGPLFELVGRPGKSFVRMDVGTRYENGAWYPADGAKKIEYGGENLPKSLSKFDSVETREVKINPLVALKNSIPGFSHPVKLEGLKEIDYFPNREVFFSRAEVGENYTVFHRVYSFKRGQLEAGSLQNAPKYLKLPETITGRTRDLADKITDNFESGYEKAEAIETYLRKNYQYDKGYERSPPSHEPIDWFLFEENRGTCTNFNSAFVVLARSAGIPSRVVNGFGHIDPEENRQKVKVEQAHLRAEVLFEDLGWVPFDATAAGECINCRGTASGLENQIDNQGENVGQEPGDNDSAPSENSQFTGLKMSAEGCKCSCKVSIFELIGSPGKPFVRLKVGGTYDDGLWSPITGRNGSKYNNQKLTQEIQNFADSQTHTVLVKPLVPIDGFVPSFSHPVLLEGLNELIFYPKHDIFFSKSKFERGYTISHRYYEFTAEELRDADLLKEDAYLQVPPDVTERTESLAQEITEGIENPYEKAKAIEEYLRSNYTYDKNYERSPPGHDPIDWFLFEEKRGVCANFNSAFVILSRCVGIPSRAVGGFAVKKDSEYQTVSSCSAHMRAEVHFEKLGWIPFDATGEDEESKEKIPTRTKITDYDKSAKVGGDFHVSGKVTTNDGTPVGGLEVLIFLKKNKEEEVPSISKGKTDNNGVLNVRFELSDNFKVGAYHIVAYTPLTDEYKASRSDPKTKILSDTSIDLSSPKKMPAGIEFTLSGDLVKKPAQEPLSSRKVHLYYGAEEVSKTTDENGRFSQRCLFEEPENYSVSASFEGSEYYNPTKAEANIEIVPVGVVPSTENRLVRGGDFEISGRVNIGAADLKILLENELITDLESGEDGGFNTVEEVPPGENLGKASLNYEMTDYSYSKAQEVEIYGKTSVNCDDNSEALSPGDNFTVTGEVLNDLGEPLGGRKVVLYYENLRKSGETDEVGRVSIQGKVPENYSKDKLSFRLEFPAQRYYLSSSFMGNYQISFPEDESKNFLWMALTVAIVSIAVAAVVVKKARGGEQGSTQREEEAERLGRIGLGGGLDSGEKSDFLIAFPHIDDPYPPVWGLGDSLKLLIASKEDGSQLEGEVKLRIDGRDEKKSQIDKSGKAEFELEFKEKGKHRIDALVEKGGLKAGRFIRIVDYREEVVDLFNSAFELFKNQGVELRDETTPREFQRRVIKSTDVDKESLDELVMNFEIARYSLREVDRNIYKKSYLAFSSIVHEPED